MLIINFAPSNINTWIMEHDYCYLNTDKMLELSKNLDGSEIKMMLAIIYVLNNTEDYWFVNNASTREMLASIGFAKSPERFSAILGSLVKKGVIKREANSVYSISRELYIVP